MFNFDEYMLHQVLAIVGIVLFIFVFVGYIITAISLLYLLFFAPHFARLALACKGSIKLWL